MPKFCHLNRNGLILIKYKSKDFKVTHQAPFSFVACFCFPDRQTDTMCENNGHLFGLRGLVGQYYYNIKL